MYTHTYIYTDNSPVALYLGSLRLEKLLVRRFAQADIHACIHTYTLNLHETKLHNSLGLRNPKTRLPRGSVNAIYE